MDAIMSNQDGTYNPEAWQHMMQMKKIVIAEL
jgi:predicted 3-demethylubiquinone-9 3-methyltransferase (glyoxalase superfamily)